MGYMHQAVYDEVRAGCEGRRVQAWHFTSLDDENISAREIYAINAVCLFVFDGSSNGESQGPRKNAILVAHLESPTTNNGPMLGLREMPLLAD
jgi:hypothetical protein